MLTNLKKDSLSLKIWIYLIFFSISILVFIWLFQIVFLNTYYETAKSREIDTAVKNLKDQYEDNESFITMLDSLTYNNNLCAQIEVEGVITYTSGSNNRNCASLEYLNKYKKAFKESNLKEEKYKLVNPKYKDKMLIHAVKLDNNTYMYINTMLEPLNSTINILKGQFIFVTIIVLFLSFLLAILISKKLSKPIEKITNKSKLLANGEKEIIFNTNTGIDEINELAKALNYTSTELAKTNELRRDLLANVSHDLKTPLTMIKAYSEMIRDITYKDKEKMNNNLKTIIDETDRLNFLVDDILTLTKLESKTIKLEKQDVNLNDLIKDILSRYRIFDDYTFVFNSKKDYKIKADKKRLEQVFYNLINNAINYTGNDKKVIISIIEEAKDLRIEVKDTGNGIKKEDIDKIWDKYYTTNKNHKRVMAGTGLGLSIVKNILELHNYDYGVESSSEGTTFYFIIKKGKKKQ